MRRRSCLMHWKQPQVILIAAWLAGTSVEIAAPITLNSNSATYTQNFDTLASTGLANAGLPAGWALSESGTSVRVNQQYAAGTGSDNTGDVYSFGSTGSSERG